MMNFNAKHRKTVASLFCLSFFLIITVSCAAAPVINMSRIASQASAVVSLIDTAEKALQLASRLVNSSYKALGDDIRSQNFAGSNKFSSAIVEEMETRYSELLAKHKTLDDSLDQTNLAADEFFSMLETRANQNSSSSKGTELRDISDKKRTFSEKIEVAKNVSSKLGTEIKDYDNILNVCQISVGLNEVQKYIKDVDLVISQYQSLEQKVQIALREGRQVITNLAAIPSPITEATVPTLTPQSPDEVIPTSIPENDSGKPPMSRPSLGVKLKSLAQEQGVLVVEVEKNSPAAEAGIKVGDVIITFNGIIVTDADEVIDEVISSQAGAESRLGIRRNQKKLVIMAHFR